jgi:hypothetical protein
VPDANVRIPSETRDRLATLAAAEGMSLRAYLTRITESLRTPAERVERAEHNRRVLREWGGYDPSPEEEALLDAELDRRIERATG